MHRTALIAAARTGLAGLAVIALGGCHSLFARHHTLSAEAVAVQTRPEIDLAGQLVAGRTALAEARYAEAIAAFSRLRGEPGYDGEACNGLAIAWAGIGRDDLAAVYFRRALAAAPDDARYQRNFARFEARQDGARQARAQLAAAQTQTQTQTQAQAAAPTSAPAVATARTAPQLTRVSAHEFVLQAASGVALWEPAAPRRHLAARPMAAPVRHAPAVLPTIAGTQGRTFVIARRAAPSSSGYPVRIVFGRNAIGAALR
jgi:tetratricopeptide (TPR) repeat protein